ncbi:MAG: hypothetical protein LW855_04060 [Alphaproteobacteria bacterium]|nr:hypothetical protein [Alphaproteobacteria bacterium]
MSKKTDNVRALLNAAKNCLRKPGAVATIKGRSAYSIAARLDNNQIITARSVTINSIFHANATERLLDTINEQLLTQAHIREVVIYVYEQMLTFACDEDINLLRSRNVFCDIAIFSADSDTLIENNTCNKGSNNESLHNRNVCSIQIKGTARSKYNYASETDFAFSLVKTAHNYDLNPECTLFLLLATLHDDYKNFVISEVRINHSVINLQHNPIPGRDWQMLHRCAPPDTTVIFENAPGGQRVTTLEQLLPDAYRTENTYFTAPAEFARLELVSADTIHKDCLDLLINELPATKANSHHRRLAALAFADGSCILRDNAAVDNLIAPSCAETQLFHALRHESTEKPTALYIALNPDEEDPRFAMPCGVCRDVGASLWGENFPLYIVHPDGRLWKADTTGFALLTPPASLVLNAHPNSATDDLRLYWQERQHEGIAALTAARCTDDSLLIDWGRKNDMQPGFLGAALNRAGKTAKSAWLVLDPTVYTAIPPILWKLRRQLGQDCVAHIAWSDTFIWQDWPLYNPQSMTMPS